VKLLIIEGNTAEARRQAEAAGLPSQSELYVSVLKSLRPDVACDIICPADGAAPLPAGMALEDYDGLVWTGSSLNIYDGTPEIMRQVDLMRECLSRPVMMFGSCWGLQVATVAAGGVVQANAKGREIGIARNIRLTEAGRVHALYQYKGGAFDSVAIHKDHVTRLPDGAVVLAENEMSAVQAMELRRGSAVFWGVQYHPEFDIPYIAGLMWRYRDVMVAEGFCRDEEDVEQLTADLLAAIRPDRKDLQWRYGLGADVLDPACRLREISNWLDSLEVRE
tara:strand:- start:4377 stop:5210 length:834 start_codon:yes stop_codon:yes gene_type:complete